MPDIRTRNNAHWKDASLPVYAARKKLRGYYGLHWHEFFEVELVVGGHGRCVLNGKDYELNPGDIYLLTTTDFHEVFSDDVEVLHIAFDQSLIASDLSEKLITCDKNLFFSLDRREYVKFYSLMSQLAAECEKDMEYKLPYITSLLQCIFILMIRKANLKNNADTDARKSHIAAAVLYLELHFRENPDLDTVAAYVGLNKNYFCGLFKRETGKTMVQYVNDLKLAYSKNLLRSTDLSITEICYNCGYNSFSNYIHKFRERYGETPLQCRKKGIKK